jgi:hypothetical protein
MFFNPSKSGKIKNKYKKKGLKKESQSDRKQQNSNSGYNHDLQSFLKPELVKT